MLLDKTRRYSARHRSKVWKNTRDNVAVAFQAAHRLRVESASADVQRNNGFAMNRLNHCRPDQATRFKKGVSGNPSGRPKSKKTSMDDTDAFNVVLSEEVTVSVNGKKRRITIRELIVRKMAEKALKGDVPTAKLMLTSVPAIAVDQQAGDWETRIANAKESLRRKLFQPREV